MAEWKDADDKPALPGYYVVLICYDTSEGAWTESGRWDGNRWNNDRGTSRWLDRRCETEEEALALAAANDVGW